MHWILHDENYLYLPLTRPLCKLDDGKAESYSWPTNLSLSISPLFTFTSVLLRSNYISNYMERYDVPFFRSDYPVFHCLKSFSLRKNSFCRHTGSFMNWVLSTSSDTSLITPHLTFCTLNIHKLLWFLECSMFSHAFAWNAILFQSSCCYWLTGKVCCNKD